MMRKIIFRAYHEYIKKMLYPIKLHLDNGVFTAFDVEGEDNVYQVKVDENQGSGIEIMQFTGLYDKNNQPIYESDLLRKNNRIYQVKYHIDNYYCGFVLHDVTGKNISHGDYDNVEIIGNIYEGI